MNFTEISLKGFLCLGSAGFPFTPGEQVDVLFARTVIHRSASTVMSAPDAGLHLVMAQLGQSNP